MAQTASTEATGNAIIQASLDRMAPVVQSDIRSIAEQALLSRSIIQVVEHYTDMMARINNAEVLNYLNSIAAPMLNKLQNNLQSLQQQMATYAGAMNPDSSEYH